MGGARGGLDGVLLWPDGVLFLARTRSSRKQLFLQKQFRQKDSTTVLHPVTPALNINHECFSIKILNVEAQ